MGELSGRAGMESDGEESTGAFAAALVEGVWRKGEGGAQEKSEPGCG